MNSINEALYSNGKSFRCELHIPKKYSDEWDDGGWAKIGLYTKTKKRCDVCLSQAVSAKTEKRRTKEKFYCRFCGEDRFLEDGYGKSDDDKICSGCIEERRMSEGDKISIGFSIIGKSHRALREF